MSKVDQMGGQHFSKMSEIQKCPKGQRGGGQPLLGHCPKFSRFSILMPPLRNIMLLFDKNKIEDIEENDTNNYIYAPVQSDDEWKIQLVNELINVKHDELVLDNLSKEEVDEIIEFLCTSCSSIFIIL